MSEPKIGPPNLRVQESKSAERFDGNHGPINAVSNLLGENTKHDSREGQGHMPQPRRLPKKGPCTEVNIRSWHNYWKTLRCP